MSKATGLESQDAHYKAQALSHLAEIRRIIRQLSADRRREERRRVGQASILSEVKIILHGT
jgi:phage-related minor tail protein